MCGISIFYFIAHATYRCARVCGCSYLPKVVVLISASGHQADGSGESETETWTYNHVADYRKLRGCPILEGFPPDSGGVIHCLGWAADSLCVGGDHIIQTTPYFSTHRTLVYLTRTWFKVLWKMASRMKDKRTAALSWTLGCALVYDKASNPVNNEVFISYLGGDEALFILSQKQKFG